MVGSVNSDGAQTAARRLANAGELVTRILDFKEDLHIIEPDGGR